MEALNIGDDIMFVWCKAPILVVQDRRGHHGVQLATMNAQWLGVQKGIVHLHMVDPDGNHADLFVPEGKIAILVPGKIKAATPDNLVKLS